MAHPAEIKFYIDTETGDKLLQYREGFEEGEHVEPEGFIYIPHDAISHYATIIETEEDHEPNETEGRQTSLHVYSKDTTRGFPVLVLTETQFSNFEKWYSSNQVEITDFDNIPDVGGTETTTSEIALVTDPVIYNRPETGISQYNIPFFKFHNPNGKSAITISMTDVDYTRFDSNSDDTHYYVVVTKGQSEIKCLCTVAEQLGLEWRFRGTTHVISASESNTTRLIQESLDNPE